MIQISLRKEIAMAERKQFLHRTLTHSTTQSESTAELESTGGQDTRLNRMIRSSEKHTQPLKRRTPTYIRLDPVSLSVDAAQLNTHRDSVGRPTKYDPSMCDKVVELGRKGYSKTQMAAELNIHRDTMYEWEKAHEEFSDTLELAMTHAQAFWEHMALKAIKLPARAFNTGLWSKIMSARFPHTYRETTRTEHSGPEGVPIPLSTQLPPLTGENLAQFYKQFMDRHTRTKTNNATHQKSSS
jgi:DNA-binding XRE family transcriptional regulator